MFNITPVTLPTPNLSGFTTLTTQSAINHVDALRVHQTQKFQTLANFGDIAYHHIHQAFAFKLPPQLVLEIQALGLQITVTGELEGLIVEGLMSASLMTWRQFVGLATRQIQSEWLIKVAGQMYDSYFRLYPYFADAKK